MIIPGKKSQRRESIVRSMVWSTAGSRFSFVIFFFPIPCHRVDRRPVFRSSARICPGPKSQLKILLWCRFVDWNKFNTRAVKAGRPVSNLCLCGSLFQRQDDPFAVDLSLGAILKLPAPGSYAFIALIHENCSSVSVLPFIHTYTLTNAHWKRLWWNIFFYIIDHVK